MRAMRFAIAAVLLAVTAGQAQAAIIQFEGVAPANSFTTYINTSFSIDGFSFFQVDGHLVDSGYASTVGYPSDNGTDWLMNHTTGPLTFSQNGGAGFSLHQLDLGGYIPNLSSEATVTGTFVGGGTINRVVAYGGQFSTVAFSSAWSNLKSVSIQSNPSSNVGFTIDNIEVNQVAVTPEPTSLALAGFAGLGMAAGAWRRRRQQAA